MLRTVKVGPYDCWADDATHPGMEILENGLNYEVHVRKELEKWIPRGAGFLDVGANVGIHTLSAKAINPDIPIVAIEMTQFNVDVLTRNVFHNQIQNVTIVPIAVAPGSCVLPASRDPADGCVTLSGVGDFPLLRPGLPLDFLNLPTIDLMKIDIEGFEYAAWQGAKKLFAMRPRIIFEFCPQIVERSLTTPTDQLDWLIKQDYRLTVLDYPQNGSRKECQTPQAVLDHMASVHCVITDILAEPE